jgi:S-adenosylmethionine synthetase
VVEQGIDGIGRLDRVDAGELEPLGAVDWLINGAGAFEIGGPEGDNGLSGKKLGPSSNGAVHVAKEEDP